jgi:hypothetical protein
MEDRDHFAAAALTGLLANEGEGPSLSNTCAYAYRIADAMLRERERNGAVSSRETVPVTEPTPKEKRAEISEWHTVPLYRHPQPTLTDAERQAVFWYAAYGAGDHAATLRSLLARLSPASQASETPRD